MNGTVKMMMAASLAACAMYAQTPPTPAGNPLVTEQKQAYTSIKTNLMRMAEKMPAENYDFKPVAEIRSFGELVAHMADSQTRMCGPVAGKQATADAASKKTKDELVAAFKASFDICDAAWDATTDANAFEMAGRRSRIGGLIYNTIHANEEYGYMAVYLRLKGIVPPSSDRSGMPPAKK